MTTHLRARTIAILGAGPSGLVAAKYLRAENAFDRIVLFEQRSRLGGIWNYTPDERDEDLFTVPQTSPVGKVQEPTWKRKEEERGVKGAGTKEVEKEDEVNGVDGGGREKKGEKEASFLSPVYEDLETNIPRGLMGFSDLDWPKDTQLFPRHESVLEYIETYAADIKHLIQFETQVTSASPTTAVPSPSTQWIVKTRNLRTGAEHEEIFDAVIVANGHFIVPYVPDIPGIAEWNERYPGSITHSKYYRRAADFAGKKVVVVGNSASGLDISAQVAEAGCLKPLLWSSRSTNMFAPPPPPSPDPTNPNSNSNSNSYSSPVPDALGRLPKPPISSFNPQTRTLTFTDGSVESDIDAILFATGYFYSLPFLSLPLPQPSSTTSPSPFPAPITTGTRINHTYAHLFYAPAPTLSFLVLNQRVIPFPFAEAQAAVLARVYAGRLPLPPLSEMEIWEREEVGRNGEGKTFHLLPFPRDAEYINAMGRWAMSARRGEGGGEGNGKREEEGAGGGEEEEEEEEKEGAENGGVGKVPPVWGEWAYWCRERFAAIRAAFKARGEERHGIRTLEELGFDFEGWKKEKEGQERAEKEKA